MVANSSVGRFDAAAMRPVIQGKNDRFAEAHVTGDSAIMLEYYTDDARIFPPNSDVVVGRAAIEALVALYVGFDIREFREETTVIYGTEDLLIDEGTYLMRWGTENLVEQGKYVNVWRNVGGDWKVCSNIWNANAPAAAQQREGA